MDLREYRLTWTIELDATSPEAAAELAEQFMFDPDRMGNVFKVYDGPSLVGVVEVVDGVGRPFNG